MAALLTLWVGGCGSGQPVARPALPKMPPKATAKVTVKAKALPPPPRSLRTQVTREWPQGAGWGNVAKGQKPLRPKDVADWKREDYENAAREGDPRLVAAVDYLGTHFAGKESAAEFLLKLLQPPPINLFADGALRPAATTNPKLSEAVVAALVANGTPRARQILEGLVEGTPKTANASLVAMAAMKTLYARPGQESEDLLVRVITAQNYNGTDDPAANDAVKLRSAAMGLVRLTASESLAIRLAKCMLAPETSKTLYDQLWVVLKEPRPENLAAQIILYQSDRLDQATHDRLEAWIVAYSSSALRCLSDIPSPPQPKGTLTKTIPATDSYRLAQRLWSSDVAAVIGRRLEAVESLDKASPLVALASTLPQATVRAALLRTLERHWDEGPRGLTMLRATEDVTAEPGFVALVKLLRREDYAELLPGRDMPGHNGNRRSPARLGAKKTADLQKIKQHEDQAGQQWMQFSQDTVRAVCRRLYAAAWAERNARNGAEPTEDDAELPFELNAGARVVAAYHRNWPEDLGGKIDAAPRLRVRFVRVEQKAAPLRVVAYYRRQFPGALEHALDGGGRWIDSILVDKQRACTRSVDVLVAKASKSALGLPNQEMELTVDILTVECEEIVQHNPVLANQ